MTKQKRTIFMVLAAILMAAPSWAEQVGVARTLEGEVAVRRSRDNDFRDVDQSPDDESPVHNMDTWRTGNESSAEIFLDNGSIFVLKPQTSVLVRVDTANRTVSIELLFGAIKSITLNSPDYQTNVLTPSAFISVTRGIFITRSGREGVLRVENETGFLEIVHNYGAVIQLGEGQGADLITDFTREERSFEIQIPSDNPGDVTTQVVDTVTIALPPGSTTQIENNMIPGQGGDIIVTTSQETLGVVQVTVGDPGSPDAVHGIEPGDRVVIRFDEDIDLKIERIDPGNLIPNPIPPLPEDNPFETPEDVGDPEEREAVDPEPVDPTPQQPSTPSGSP